VGRTPRRRILDFCLLIKIGLNKGNQTIKQRQDLHHFARVDTTGLISFD
jgi:hypothetical protein